ncbi:flagellar M-ring protein [Primorskyibacter flagellatus]|uniref:Flagellar M-ring protein n=1 Tax=Primorskyibacter flagellatus TaxID=1387277 RepID=A0A917AFS5_9RHOB|nr:flagellar basal-body MS-ring/collar protein FliF [Primorskyibacter flagellatus]GGE47280.1 flagellar M-ring protein [Primorskyibacter flagellatus]
MTQLIDIWTGMTPARRAVAVLSVIATVVTLAALTRMVTQPGLALLYSGLEDGQAGDVVRALEQRGADFDVRGGAIYVSRARRDELRMTLASEGLPRNTTQGYELLDSLSGFGMTSQMFDAAYWRAKEGELARTIAASPQIQSARVHIANAGSNPFQRDLKPTASVSVGGSGSLTAGQVRALKFLVASAVAGLRPEDVAVIDGAGELLAGDPDPAPDTAGADRADRLRDKVQRLLEARVGYGNAVVEISLDTETDSESIRERRFDPDSRVAISTETETRSGTSSNGSGEVTVASNLPDSETGGGGSSSQSSENRERVNYEVSETEREILRVPGAVKRMTVAILINGQQVTQEDGTTEFTPRTEEEIATLRDLVQSAVGFDEDRGDVITIKSMLFEEIVPEGTQVSDGWLQDFAPDPVSIAQIALLAVVALILGLFVIRPVLRAPPAGLSSLPAPATGAAAPEPEGEALTGEIADDDFALPDLPIISDFDTGGLPGFDGTDSGDDPVARLQSLITERRDEAVEILRGWLEDREEPAQ